MSRGYTRMKKARRQANVRREKVNPLTHARLTSELVCRSVLCKEHFGDIADAKKHADEHAKQ